ncbi:hypothetical protein [uncultured Ruminococcus sp.]|uniref:hypothetical protein n=1 Tax=uncultured Ruminococcus sp. TaxID=165186 RepID=UPI0025F0A343|nr:hypothetical protein [uncultured Ruminococcus sp.]
MLCCHFLTALPHLLYLSQSRILVFGVICDFLYYLDKVGESYSSVLVAEFYLGYGFILPERVNICPAVQIVLRQQYLVLRLFRTYFIFARAAFLYSGSSVTSFITLINSGKVTAVFSLLSSISAMALSCRKE